MKQTFYELLLSELHMVVYEPGNTARLNDKLLCEAVTVNENLRSLGFVLKPEDLVRLAVSPSMHGFYEAVKAMLPDVKAQPMYPGFPQQVMNMSEAEFRMHQMMHYFSTYGMELLFGVKVHRGWLPEYQGPARTQDDTTLLAAKVLELVDAGQAHLTALKRLLARRERLTNPELQLVLESAAVCTPEQMEGLTIRFKENLELLFPLLLEEADRDTALRTLRCICAHTGDVLRCTASFLSHRRYHLRTSEKKLLVKLLESYPVHNFRQNLIQSQSLRERNLTVLRHLDYNQYSRSPEHREAVRALRNSELLSWHGIAEAMLKERNPKALGYLAQRPGYMLRMLNRLLSLGYEKDAIEEVLLPRAGAISAHLILQAVRSLAGRADALEESYRQEESACLEKFRQEACRLDPDRIRDNFLCRQEYCMDRCQQQIDRLMPEYLRMEQRNARSWEAEWKRTEARQQVQQLKQKDLDAFHTRQEALESSIREMQTQLAQADTAVFRRWPYLRAVAHHNMVAAGVQETVSGQVLAQYLPANGKKLLQKLRLDALTALQQLEQERSDATAWMEAQRTGVWREAEARCAEAIRQADAWEKDALARVEESFRWNPDPRRAEREALAQKRQQELDTLEQQYRQEQLSAEEARKTLPSRQQQELDAIVERYRKQVAISRYDPDAVEILKALLWKHFRQAVTPLQGKKVCLDLKQFDLRHSSLETRDRSKDGGYIRSGIAWKIPDNARYVRFFVYWNDPERVDIDLHAGGTTTDGNHLHIGWCADFRNSGAVYSGDITHSNAAEYIDIDLNAPIREISANIHLYGGKSGFPEVETCYVGLMAVDQLGQEVKHYNPKNCFFTHTLTQNLRSMFYGFVDVQNRCVRFVGKPNEDFWDSIPKVEDQFSLQDYLDCLLDAQQVQLVESEAEADLVLTMGKGLQDNAVSLVDHNFFLES